jgi:hypothetical protein
LDHATRPWHSFACGFARRRRLRSAPTLAGGGCAKSPESIAPAYVSTVNFQSWSCNQLAEEGRRLSQALAEARNARTNDTIGVIFLGLPVSSLSGDNIAPQIANLKGQMVAVQQAGSSKNCGFRVETASVR